MTLQVPLSVVGYDVCALLILQFPCFCFSFRMEWWMALYRWGPPIWWTAIWAYRPGVLFFLGLRVRLTEQ